MSKGIKVSKPGVDVKTAEDKDLVWSSEFKTPKIYRVVNAKALFYDDFERASVGSDWNTSSLASAVLHEEYSWIGKQLVTEAPADTWGQDPQPQALLNKSLGLDGDFIIKVDFEWVERPSDLADIQVELYDDNGDRKIRAGMRDAWAANSGEFTATIGAEVMNTGQGSRPASGSMDIRIEREGDTVSIYEDLVKRLEVEYTGTIDSLGLSNARLTTYNGKTARWTRVFIFEPVEHGLNYPPTFLPMYADNDSWYDFPFLKVTDEKIYLDITTGDDVYVILFVDPLNE